MTKNEGQPKGDYIIAWIVMSLISGGGTFVFAFVISIIFMATTGNETVVDESWFLVWIGVPSSILICAGTVYVVYRKLFKKLNRAKVMIWFYTLWTIGSLSQIGEQANGFAESERGFIVGMGIFWLALGLFIIRKIMLPVNQVDRQQTLNVDEETPLSVAQKNRWTEEEGFNSEQHKTEF